MLVKDNITQLAAGFSRMNEFDKRECHTKYLRITNHFSSKHILSYL